MLKLQTPVETGKSKVKVSVDDRILVLGSCFADNTGKKMTDLGLKACVNPFGTLYNPLSILSSLKRLLSEEPFTASDCRMMGSGAGLVCSFHHHTSFARKTEEEFLENANSALKSASLFFRECEKVLITFGTSRCYRHIADDMIVSNCLKRDAREFAVERMTVEAVTDAMEEIHSICTASGKEMIFTVSPIRHIRDGLHSNQLSKSVLLLAVDAVCRETEDCHYFPAYEIMLDELRDYRFYAEDMCHPSRQSVNYIWERFAEHAVDPGMRTAIAKIEKLAKAAAHRPLFPDSDTYKVFRDRVLKDISEFRAEWPDAVLPEFPSK